MHQCLDLRLLQKLEHKIPHQEEEADVVEEEVEADKLLITCRLLYN